ncbi:MAG: outer membrane lipoprotein-sorting protein [Gammaproteobacteria bacterium]|nr:outer membrane lipoprotein-sorting protein [Gammaproteobacteria bacterium]
MSRINGWCIVAVTAWLLGGVNTAAAQSAAEIVKAAIDYWRDSSSYSVAEMTIHRPDWQRSMTFRVWTRGEKRSLVRVTAPAKDAGNATLLIDNEMWSFTPRINRVIKIPSSMMNQSWMGSDFSNNDLAKADDLIEQYHHKLLGTESRDGHTVYVIESIPKETAPVVWGKEIVTVRDDYVLLEHVFYDQQGVLIKKLTTRDIRPMGGKTVAARQRMQRVDKPEEWTEVTTREIKFGIEIAPTVFTLGNLRNPRE